MLFLPQLKVICIAEEVLNLENFWYGTVANIYIDKYKFLFFIFKLYSVDSLTKVHFIARPSLLIFPLAQHMQQYKSLSIIALPKHKFFHYTQLINKKNNLLAPIIKLSQLIRILKIHNRPKSWTTEWPNIKMCIKTFPIKRKNYLSVTKSMVFGN